MIEFILYILSDNIGLSYLAGALVTASIILIVILLHYFTRINHVILFWIAFVFTRPFGATFGDLLTKSLSKGGLNLGTLHASLVCVVIIALLILMDSKRQVKSA